MEELALLAAKFYTEIGQIDDSVICFKKDGSCPQTNSERGLFV